MINLYNQVPSVYVNASRDFQYLSWLFNIVLNSVKHNVDDIYKLPIIDSDTKLTELLARTLGFKVKRNYDKKQLLALVSALPSILRYKGTEKAITMAANALVMAAGSLGSASVQLNGTEIRVTLPKDLIDITLFLDLLDYILPAGMTCRVVRKNEIKKSINNIEVKHRDTLNVLLTDDAKLNNLEKDFNNIGLATLYMLNNSTGVPEFSANIRKLENGFALNAGLLDTAITPVLSDSMLIDPLEYLVLHTTEGTDENNQPIIQPLTTADDLKLAAKKPITNL